MSLNNGRKCGSMNQAEKQNADTMKGELKQAEQRANELYPNDRAFCGGVASIARDAYLKGVQETLEKAVKWLQENADTYIVDLGIGYLQHDFKVGGMCWVHLKEHIQ